MTGVAMPPLLWASSASAPNGFLDLINMLAGLLDSNIISDVANPRADVSNVEQLNPRVAPDVAIADSLIRRMLGGKTAAPSATAQPKPTQLASQTTTDSPILPLTIQVSVAAPLPEIAGLLPEFDGVETPTSGSQAQPLPAAPQAAPQVVSQAPISFEAQLVPIALVNAKDDSSDTAATPQEPKGSPRVVAFQLPHVTAHNPQDDSPHVTPVGATQTDGFADGFAKASENPATPQAPHCWNTDVKTSSTFGTVAEILRSAETSSISTPQPASSGTSVQDITVRIARPEMAPVDLHVTERGGEIHVAVRTADAGLEASLRHDLGTLTISLERAGYRAETFVPRGHEAVLQVAKSSEYMDARDDSEAREAKRGFANREGGESNGGRQQQQRNRNNRTSPWNDEMEKQQ
jgi:hypothetical protein